MLNLVKLASWDLSNRLETEGFPIIKVGLGISTNTDLCATIGAGVQYEYCVIGGMNISY